MSKRCRAWFTFLIALMIPGVALQVGTAQAPAPKAPPPEANVVGRWQVTLILGGVRKDLIFESKVHGLGSFLLKETGPAGNSIPAVWSRNSNDRVSFSGEAELPLGTCCVELGTVVFKGRFESKDSIAGKVVFVTGIDEEESPYKLRSVIGTFTAVRIVQRRSKSGTAGTWSPGALRQQRVSLRFLSRCIAKTE
jgi:hypothetical protein